MAQFINQNSFVLLSILVIIFLAAWLWRDGIKLNDFLWLAAAGLVLVIGWLILRPTPSQNALDATQISAQIGNGKPLLLEFQSAY